MGVAASREMGGKYRNITLYKSNFPRPWPELICLGAFGGNLLEFLVSVTTYTFYLISVLLESN